jgi:hypothetical protein
VVVVEHPLRACRCGRPAGAARDGGIIMRICKVISACSATTTMSFSGLPTELLIQIICLCDALSAVKCGMVRWSPIDQHRKSHLRLWPPDMQAGKRSRADPGGPIFGSVGGMRDGRLWILGAHLGASRALAGLRACMEHALLDRVSRRSAISFPDDLRIPQERIPCDPRANF